MTINFLIPPPIPAVLPESLETEIIKLRQFNNRKEVLEYSYAVLTKKYRGYRLKTFTRLVDLFDTDLESLWRKQGFLHCNNMNYLLQVMLIKSGKFTSEDIVFKWTTLHVISPHEYLQVRIGESQWLDVDVWGNVYGIKLGDHAHGFHFGHLAPVS